MKISYSVGEREKLKDIGKALQFMLDFCGYREKCRECDFENACYNLSKIADEFVSIGEVKVNITVEFRDVQDLRKTIEVLWRSKCPLTQEKSGCEWRNYQTACAKVRDICYKLEERYNSEE